MMREEGEDDLRRWISKERDRMEDRPTENERERENNNFLRTQLIWNLRLKQFELQVKRETKKRKTWFFQILKLKLQKRSQNSSLSILMFHFGFKKCWPQRKVTRIRKKLLIKKTGLREEWFPIVIWLLQQWGKVKN